MEIACSFLCKCFCASKNRIKIIKNLGFLYLINTYHLESVVYLFSYITE